MKRHRRSYFVRLVVLLFSVVFLFLSVVLLGNAFSWTEEVTEAAHAVANGTATPKQQAIAFQNNKAINEMALTGKIPEKVYHANQSSFEKLNNRFVSEAASENGMAAKLQQKPANKVSQPGTDTDALLEKGKSEKPITSKQVANTTESYNRKVDKFLQENGVQTSGKENWARKTATDFMPVPSHTTPEEFGKIAAETNKRGGTMYKDPRAVEVEAQIRGGEKINIKDANAYVKEMQNLAKDKLNQANELDRQAREIRRTSPQNEALKSLEAEAQLTRSQAGKYIERIDKVGGKIAEQHGVVASKPQGPAAESVSAVSDKRGPGTARQAANVGVLGEHSLTKSTQSYAENLANIAKANPELAKAAQEGIAKSAANLSPSQKGELIGNLRNTHGDEFARGVAKEMKVTPGEPKSGKPASEPASSKPSAGKPGTPKETAGASEPTVKEGKPASESKVKGEKPTSEPASSKPSAGKPGTPEETAGTAKGAKKITEKIGKGIDKAMTGAMIIEQAENIREGIKKGSIDPVVEGTAGKEFSDKSKFTNVQDVADKEDYSQKKVGEEVSQQLASKARRMGASKEEVKEAMDAYDKGDKSKFRDLVKDLQAKGAKDTKPNKPLDAGEAPDLHGSGDKGDSLKDRTREAVGKIGGLDEKLGDASGIADEEDYSQKKVGEEVSQQLASKARRMGASKEEVKEAMDAYDKGDKSKFRDLVKDLQAKGAKDTRAPKPLDPGKAANIDGDDTATERVMEIGAVKKVGHALKGIHDDVKETLKGGDQGTDALDDAQKKMGEFNEQNRSIFDKLVQSGVDRTEAARAVRELASGDSGKLHELRGKIKNEKSDKISDLKGSEAKTSKIDKEKLEKSPEGQKAGMELAQNTNVTDSYGKERSGKSKQKTKEVQDTAGSTLKERGDASQSEDQREKTKIKGQGEQTDRAISSAKQEHISAEKAAEQARQTAIGTVIAGGLFGGLSSGVAVGLDSFFGTIGKGAGQHVSGRMGIQPPPSSTGAGNQAAGGTTSAAGDPLPWTYSGTCNGTVKAKANFGAGGSVSCSFSGPSKTTLNADGSVTGESSAGFWVEFSDSGSGTGCASKSGNSTFNGSHSNGSVNITSSSGSKSSGSYNANSLNVSGGRSGSSMSLNKGGSATADVSTSCTYTRVSGSPPPAKP